MRMKKKKDHRLKLTKSALEFSVGTQLKSHSLSLLLSTPPPFCLCPISQVPTQENDKFVCASKEHSWRVWGTVPKFQSVKMAAQEGIEASPHFEAGGCVSPRDSASDSEDGRELQIILLCTRVMAKVMPPVSLLHCCACSSLWNRKTQVDHPLHCPSLLTCSIIHC